MKYAELLQVSGIFSFKHLLKAIDTISLILILQPHLDKEIYDTV
jgi:hypothetical protein